MIKFGNFWPGIAKVGLTASNRGSIEHQPKGFSSETKLTLQLWAIQPIRNFAVAAVDIVIVIVIANNFVFVFIFTSMYHHSICWGRFHGWPVVWGLGTGWATRAHLSLSAYHLRMHIFFFFFWQWLHQRNTARWVRYSWQRRPCQPDSPAFLTAWLRATTFQLISVNLLIILKASHII